MRFLFCPGTSWPGPPVAGGPFGRFGVGRGHPFMLCRTGAYLRHRRGRRRAGAACARIRSVSWEGDRAVRTGGGPRPAPVRPRLGAPRVPKPAGARADQGWNDPPPVARSGLPRHGPAGPEGGPAGATAPLGRQLAAGAAPVVAPAAWMWLLFAGLGFLGGQVLAAMVGGARRGGQRQPALAVRNHQAVSEPPTWYIVSTLIGLWAGFFGAAWLASSVRGTHSLVRDMGLAVPLDRPARAPDRGRLGRSWWRSSTAPSPSTSTISTSGSTPPASG